MRKSKLLTFLFAFIPGCGEMYLGMMRKGVFLMVLFWGVNALSLFFQMGVLLCLQPVIWFYSFFETFNIRYLAPEVIRENDLLFFQKLTGSFSAGELPQLLGRRHLWAGAALILFGGWVLFRNFLIPALEALFPTLSESWYFQYFLNQIPSAAVAVAVVLLGVHLVRGKRKPKEEEYVEYRGERHD